MNSARGNLELIRLCYATRFNTGGTGKRLRKELQRRVLDWYGGSCETTTYTEGCRWHWYRDVFKKLEDTHTLNIMESLKDMKTREQMLLQLIFSNSLEQEPAHCVAKKGQLGIRTNMLPPNAPVIRKLNY